LNFGSILFLISFRDGPLDIWGGVGVGVGEGVGQIQKKIRAQKKSWKKISCTTNLLKKKIEQELGVIFKIVMQLF
jgi:hypothetical protein